MKGKMLEVLSVLAVCALLVVGCKSPTGEATPTGEAQAGLPNPSAVYCEEQGGAYEIRTAEDGSQDGVCIFEDGSACNGWAFFRGECQPGAALDADASMPNPSAVYCEEQGGAYEIRTAEDGSQDGVCIFEDGSACNGWAFFRGECQPGAAPDTGEGVVGMANPASVYCEEQGGALEMQTDDEGNQFGVCILEDGTTCEEWAYFLGECGPAKASAEAAGDGGPVYGWLGLVVSAGEGDRLELLPQGAGSVDLVVDPTGDAAAALAAARDGIIPVHIWGALECAAGSCKVTVTRAVSSGTPEALAPDPVEGWQGTLEPLPATGQFDDVFILYHPDVAIHYGIDAPDAEVAADLAGLRGTGRAFFVYGELTCNVIDVNGCQIRADRIEIRE